MLLLMVVLICSLVSMNRYDWVKCIVGFEVPLGDRDVEGVCRQGTAIIVSRRRHKVHENLACRRPSSSRPLPEVC